MWNPDFAIADYENQRIVKEDGTAIYADEIEFNQYACLNKSKIIELNSILRRARIYKQEKDFNKLMMRMNHPR